MSKIKPPFLVVGNGDQDSKDRQQHTLAPNKGKSDAYYAGYQAGITGKIGAKRDDEAESYTDSLAWLEGWLEGVEQLERLAEKKT